jgi:hypothetical protein
MGLFSGPNQATIMSLAPRDALTTAGAATALTRSVGFALGPALCTLIHRAIVQDPVRWVPQLRRASRYTSPILARARL